MSTAVTHVKVYLNEGPDHIFGFRHEFANSPALQLAAEFDLTAVHITSREDVRAVLATVFEQLNIGGDLVAATEWTAAYRSAGHRSLSVGDVVVLGESAFAVAEFGFEPISTAELVEAINTPSGVGRR